MCKNAVFILLWSSENPVSLRKENQESPLKSMAATEKHSSAPQRGRHLCHLTSALSMQQDSVRLRRCGSRRHLRGRIALQANLSLQPTNPGCSPRLLTV